MTMVQKLTAAQRKLYAPIEEGINDAAFHDWCAAIIETLSDSTANRLLPVVRETVTANTERNGGREQAQIPVQMALTMLFTFDPAFKSYWKDHKEEQDELAGIFIENMPDAFREYTPYAKIAQNRVTNALAAIPRGAIQLKLDSPDAVATVGKGKGKVDFVLRDALENGGLKTQDQMLLDALLMEFQKTHQQITALSIDDYLRLRGREVTASNRKEMRKEVLASLERLLNIRFTYNEKVRGKYYQRGNVRLNGGTAVIENSVIKWNWNISFMDSLMQLPPLDYAKETLLADPRTNVYYFSRFLDLHQRRNEGKPNENTVTVAKLLEVARNISTIEEVKAKRGSPKQKIIEPFFRDLDNIDRLLYSVYDADGNEIQPEEIIDYETFIGCKIVFTLEGRPENLERIAARKKREKKQGK